MFHSAHPSLHHALHHGAVTFLHLLRVRANLSPKCGKLVGPLEVSVSRDPFGISSYFTVNRIMFPLHTRGLCMHLRNVFHAPAQFSDLAGFRGDRHNNSVVDGKKCF
jgi:hypothetical protein